MHYSWARGVKFIEGIYLFIFYIFNVFWSCSRIFHSYRDATIAVEGLQNLPAACCLRAFSRERLSIVLPDLGLNGLIHKAAPFSRLLQQARDTEELLF